MTMPRLCIGLPVYNGEAYLAPALDSLLGQTFSDFRLIVSDNASSDGTEAICRSYARRDARIEYHRAASNHGLTWNFNRVVELADGEYFKWAAYDDLHAPRFLERCIATLDADPRAILAYTAYRMIDERGVVVAAGREPANATAEEPSARFADLVWNWGACLMLFGVMRLAVLRQTQRLHSYPAADTVLLAELGLRGALRELDEPLFFWRNHAKRPTRVCASDSELATWYAPENAGRMQFRHLTLFAGYLRTIARVRLPLGQRLRCAAVMGRWFVLKFPTITDEVRGNIAGPVRRAFGRWTRAPSPTDPTR